MKQIKHLYRPIWLGAVILYVCLTAGCSDLGSSKDAPTDEIIAHMLSEKTISLYKKTDGEFVSLGNGAYMTPGVYTLGIKVASFDQVDLTNQKVTVSDGNEDTQLEASLNENGYYVCDFEFASNKYLTYPILIQAISEDNSASREKILLTTHNNLRPETGKLVKKGLGITVSPVLLDSLKAQFQPLIDEQLPGANIQTLGTAQNTPPDATQGTLHVDGTLPVLTFDVPFAADLILTDTDDTGLRGLYAGLEDISLFTDGLLQWVVEMVVGMLNIDVVIPLEPVSLDLWDILKLTLENDCTTEKGVIVDILLDYLQLDSTLFVNALGIPDETDNDFAALFGGLFSIDTPLVEIDENDIPLWPLAEEDPKDPEFNFSKIKNNTTDVGVALSSYNLNQILSDISSSLEVKLGPEFFGNLIEDILPGYSIPDSDDVVNITLTVNPAGAAIDLNSEAYDTGALIALNDLRLNVSFNDEEEPVIVISMDLTLDLSISTRIDECGKLNLDLSMDPIMDLCHWNIMKNDSDFDMTDDPMMLNLIIDLLADEESGSIDLPISLTDLGLTPAGDDAGTLEFDKMGNCYMNLAIESLDTSAFCFVSVASFR